MSPARRLLRRTLAVVVWVPVHLADRLQGVDPPASLRRGLDWADGREAQTSDRDFHQ